MRLDLRPHLSSELLPIQACSLQALDSCEFANAHAGVSKDGTLCWIYKGEVLEVINMCTGLRVASLQASQIQQDKEATVVCVSEFRCQGRARLLLGINGVAEQGIVCLLDLCSAMVVRAIEIPQKVTSIEPVLTKGGNSVPSWAISEQLCKFHGILAVGTDGGYIYLVDMCLDKQASTRHYQDTHPSPLLLLDPRTKDITHIRQQAVARGQHLAICLGVDEQSHINNCFHYRRPDLSIIQSFDIDEVQVTCLKYIPQSGSLAIGYSFGGFHLWKLFNPVLEYTSSFEPEDLPVAFFVYQEPENDPKNFAYLWVARDDRISEIKQESVCSVSLYQLCYSRKIFYAKYGYFWEELISVLNRLEHSLTTDPFSSRNTATATSQILSAFEIVDPNYQPPSSLTVNDSLEEGYQMPDLSLCAFVWEARDMQSGRGTDFFLSIFDMNRWYHAQMPTRVKCINVGGQDYCPFFAAYLLNDAVQQPQHGSLLDVHIKTGSLLHFVNNSPLPPEQHFYPSSLSFDGVLLFTNGILSASFLGIQRQVLANLETNGPSCLLRPSDLYHSCIQAGLLPRSPDVITSSMEEYQRKAILTLALEQGKIHFIASCIRTWADGEFVHQGCTLQMLLVWTWERVTAIKQQIDTTCQPLYNWSGMPVDQRMLQVLLNHSCSLSYLKTILQALLNPVSPITDQGQAELEQRIEVVSLLRRHLKLVLWFIHNGLLPEYDEAGDASPFRYLYPASGLAQIFQERRAEIRKLHGVVDTHDMMLIDALVHSTGDAIVQHWKCDGGSGSYPPPSLHAALTMHLLDNVPESIKDAITLYLLFDLATVAHGQQEEFAEKIPLFMKSFDLPYGLVQQVHGFWLIDHRDFEEGIAQLLRQGTCEDLGTWQHACLLRSLMIQGEASAAARYLSARNPPILTQEDVHMRLTILVANRLVCQAVEYVRYSSGVDEQEAMLRHIFSECQKRKFMELLFELPLTDVEENCLQVYLSESVDPVSAELLVLHLLQRAQYVTAIRLNDRMRHRATMDMSVKARERAKTRNALVEGFRSCLPASQQYLINHPLAPVRSVSTERLEVPRPKPLTTVVNKQLDLQVNSQSTLIMAVMEKVVEAERLLSNDEKDRANDESAIDINSNQSRNDKVNRVLSVNNPGPFLCTPATPRTQRQLNTTVQVVYPVLKPTGTFGMSLSHLHSPKSPQSPLSVQKSQVFTADCMSLLQTPKISHQSSLQMASARFTPTPQSILKVSRLPCPSIKSRDSSPSGQHKRQGFSGSLKFSSSVTPTSITPSSTPSPSLTPSLVRFDDVVVPKQLRFAEPETREISPVSISPDHLLRRPLRSSIVDEKLQTGQKEQEELTVIVDEEVSFNFSRPKAESMVLTPSPLPSVNKSVSQSMLGNSHNFLSSLSASFSESHSFSRSLVQKESPGLVETGGKKIENRHSSSSKSLLQKENHGLVQTDDKEISELTTPNFFTSIQENQRILFERDSTELKDISQLQSLSSKSFSSQTSEDSVEELEIKVVSERKRSAYHDPLTLLLISERDEDLIPVIEFEDGSEKVIAATAEAMETIDYSDVSDDASNHQLTKPHSEYTHELNDSQVLEITADMATPELEIEPPTPIMFPSADSTPCRLSEEPMTRNLRLRWKESATSELISLQDDAQPSTSKQRKISPSNSETEVLEQVWSQELPSLQLEISEEENSNDNKSSNWQTLSPSRTTIHQSVESVSPENCPQSLKLSSHNEESSINTESLSDKLFVAPAPSPQRRSTRLGSKGKTELTENITISSETVKGSEKSMDASLKDLASENSVSGVENGKHTVNTTDTDRATLSKDELQQPDIRSPTRLFPLQSKTPAKEVHLVEPLTPVRRSTRHSKAPEILQVSNQPSSSPGRRKVQNIRIHSEEDDAGTPTRKSSRQSRIPDMQQVPSVTSSAKQHSNQAQKETKEFTRSLVLEVHHEIVSPGRRSSRFSKLGESSTNSVDFARASPGQTVISPGRTGTILSKERTASTDSSDSASLASTSRRSLKIQPKTPELSPARYTTRLKSRQTNEVMQNDVAENLAVATEHLRRSRKLQKEISPRSAVKKNLEASLEINLHPSDDLLSFQFAPPTPLISLSLPADTSAVSKTNMAEFSFSKPLAHTRVLRTHSQTTASTQTVPKTDVGGHKVQAQSTSGSQSLSSIVEPSLDNSSVSQTTSSRSHLLQHDDEMHMVPAKKETKRKSSAAAVHGGDKTRATSKKKRGLPSASPTDSPINLLSPGLPVSATASMHGRSRTSRSSRAQKGSRKPKSTRNLRKRSVKLW